MQSQTNLVPNPSFEDTLGCPVNYDQLDLANGWSTYRGSCDYFNTCCIWPNVAIPYNFVGYQMPSMGNAYAGFFSYGSEINDTNLREFLGRQLISPLTVGTKYYVSFEVSLGFKSSNGISCASNNIGIQMSTQSYDPGNAMPLSNNPTINYNTIITDTVNWTVINGSFIADSAYTNVVIGNFYTNDYTDTLILDGASYCYAYYLVDNVCISTDSAYCSTWTGINEIESNGRLSVFPNPANSFFILDNAGTPYDMRIFDTLGKLLYCEREINDRRKLVDCSFFPPGLVYIEAINALGISCKKIIIEK